jgi:cytochrome c oxidase subunit II
VRRSVLRRAGLFVLLSFALLRAGTEARSEARVRTFDITASKFSFDPASIEVDQGDRVAVTLHSTDVKHGFALKPFGVKTVVPRGGESVSVEFTADKPGTFSFSCSEYCGSRHNSMKGQLLVRPRVQP